MATVMLAMVVVVVGLKRSMHATSTARLERWVRHGPVCWQRYRWSRRPHHLDQVTRARLLATRDELPARGCLLS